MPARYECENHSLDVSINPSSFQFPYHDNSGSDQNEFAAGFPLISAPSGEDFHGGVLERSTEHEPGADARM